MEDAYGKELVRYEYNNTNAAPETVVIENGIVKFRYDERSGYVEVFRNIDEIVCFSISEPKSPIISFSNGRIDFEKKPIRIYLMRYDIIRKTFCYVVY